MRATVLLLLSTLFAATANADILRQHDATPVLRITDGDTIRLHDVRVRIWGIAAPEADQTCSIDGEQWRIGQRATEALSEIIGDAVPLCHGLETDRYGRTVALCSVNGVDLGAAMVARGWAMDYERYSGGRYAAEQAEAQHLGLGMWAGHCTAPWEWRRQH